MRYGFTGTRRLQPEHYAHINTVLESLGDASEFTTGGSTGVDAYIARVLRDLYPQIPQRIVSPSDAKYTDNEIYEWASSGGAKLIQMPPDSDYRDRNGRILDFSEELIGFPLREAALEKRSGTWMTIRMAEKRGIPLQVHLLQPST